MWSPLGCLGHPTVSEGHFSENWHGKPRPAPCPHGHWTSETLRAVHVLYAGIPVTAIAASAYPWLNDLPVLELEGTPSALGGWGTPGGPSTAPVAELVGVSCPI